jgi:hypothetical protein
MTSMQKQIHFGKLQVTFKKIETYIFFIPSSFIEAVQTAPEMYCLRTEYKLIMTRWIKDVAVGFLKISHYFAETRQIVEISNLSSQFW